jgi:hypothetical protein
LAGELHIFLGEFRLAAFAGNDDDVVRRRQVERRKKDKTEKKANAPMERPRGAKKAESSGAAQYGKCFHIGKIRKIHSKVNFLVALVAKI